MPQFFINRPVFASVIAIFIALAGVVAIPQLPVSRYPVIAPPSIGIFTTYTGASVQTVNDSVVAPIEKELSSVKNVLYYESTVDWCCEYHGDVQTWNGPRTRSSGRSKQVEKCRASSSRSRSP